MLSQANASFCWAQLVHHGCGCDFSKSIGKLCVNGIYISTLRLSYLSIGTMNQKLKYIYIENKWCTVCFKFIPNATHYVSINKSQCFLYTVRSYVCLLWRGVPLSDCGITVTATPPRTIYGEVLFEVVYIYLHCLYRKKCLHISIYSIYSTQLNTYISTQSIYWWPFYWKGLLACRRGSLCSNARSIAITSYTRIRRYVFKEWYIWTRDDEHIKIFIE